MMEYRNGTGLEFRVRDKTAGIVEARVNQLLVVDDYQSIFSDGFWDKAIAKQGKMPKILVDHEGRRAGHVTETRQVWEGKRLFQHAVLQYNLRSQYGAEAFEDVNDGTDDEFSNGFVTAKQHIERRDGQSVVIKDEPQSWYEVSQVLAGASPGTGVIDVRSLEGVLATMPDLAKLLEEHGYSLLDGKLIAPDTSRSLVLPLETVSGASALDTRIGARNAAADQKRVQAIHDLTAELGAQCADASEPDADDATRSLITRAYRLRLAALELN